jgi:hypothetical protein
MDGVLVPEEVGVPVGEELGVTAAVTEGESEVLGLAEGLAPSVSEAVGERLPVLLLDTVLVEDWLVLGDKEAAPAPASVGVPVAEAPAG